MDTNKSKKSSSTLPTTFSNTEIAFANKSNIDLYKAHTLFKIMSNQVLVNLSSTLAQWSLKWHLPVTPLIKYSIYEQFCGGETLKESQRVVNKLAESNIFTLLDYGVEAKETNKDFAETEYQILKAIRYSKDQPKILAVSCKITGLAKFKLLQKMSSSKAKALNKKEQQALATLKERLHNICNAAQKAGIAVYFDAEESWIQKALDSLITEMMGYYNIKAPIVFNTIQLYRHDRYDFMLRSHERAVNKGYILAIKLVRGAYMEKERDRAKSKGYVSPIHANKAAVDADYNKALNYCIQHLDTLAFCNASHNEQSNLYLCQLMHKKNIKPNHAYIHFAQLYGMSDNISFNLAKGGYNIGKYIPYGPVKEVIPYLIRRANENTSVSGQTTRELRLIKEELKRRQLED